jgi:EmrB/QacA subfamily drug resistance transporter
MTLVRGRQANPFAPLMVLCLGFFMTLLDVTILQTAIPRLVDGLHASFDQVLWVLNAYSLIYATVLITSGRLGDILGPRRLYLAGLAVFVLGSAASGLAQEPAQLIAARSVQGLGAAILAPQMLPLLLGLFPAERRAMPFAVLGMLSGLAVLGGPTLGGVIVTHFGWRWIFYVNVPVGALTILGTLFLVPDLRPGRPHRIDLAGVLLATAGLFALVFGLIEGQRYDWGTVWSFVSVPAIVGAGVLLLAAFFVHQSRHQHGEPLVTFAVFRDRNFALAAVVLGVLGFSLLATYLPLSIYFQSVLGMSAQDAGLTLAPQALTMMFVSPVAAMLLQRVSGKALLIAGLALFAAGVAYLGWAVQVDATRWSFLPGLIAAGAGLGLTWTPLFGLATRDLKPELAGVGSGIVNTILELGGVIASAAVGALLQNRLAAGLHDQALRVAQQVPVGFRDAFVGAFTGVARRGLEVGAGQTGGSLSLPPGVPPEVAAQLSQAAHAVFAQAFVDAMRLALLLPVALLVVATFVALGFRSKPVYQAEAGEERREAAAV